MIDPSKSFPSMKAEKVNPHTNFGGTPTNLAKPKATAPAPKQVDPHTAAAQTLKAQHDAKGHLLSHVAPAGEARDLATAIYPSMCAPYEIKTPEGYSHLVPNAKQTQEFLALARSFGLNQQQVNQLVLCHCKCFDKAGG